MRCPECRKKVHGDDIYCIWCGAMLQRDTQSSGHPVPGEILPEDEVYEIPDAPEVEKPRRMGWILPALLMLVLIPALVFSWNRPAYSLTETTDLTVPENAEMLDLVLAQWEGFTLRGSYLVYDETNGVLEIVFSAENRTKQTVICGDPLFTLEGCQLQGTMYLELGPKESATGNIRLETEPLLSLGCQSFRELALSFLLYDGEEGTVLTQTEPVCLTVEGTLPEREVQISDTVLLEEAGLRVRLTGIFADPDSREIRLYTLAENFSGQETFLYLKDIRLEGAGTGGSFYYTLPPETRLLTCSRIPVSPHGISGEIQMEIVTETASGTAVCKIFDSR